MVNASMKRNSGDYNEDLLRHMILNSIRILRNKFADDYGEFIIACDDKNYWRKKYFPYYKANRKKYREKSHLDWNAIFNSLNKIRDELKEYFPYRVIQVKNAEADDVIGAICNHFGTYLGGDPILIISGDKDFKQLQKYANVKQYDPTRKRWLKTNKPEEFLIEHILRGDTGDGVPNILSDDDVFVTDKRQSPLREAKFNSLMKFAQEQDGNCHMTEKEIRNFTRNQKLVDLNEIPMEISKQVIDQFNEQEGKTRMKLFNYFIKNKLKQLMENIGEF
jgi:5'-3' exonuclease